MLQDNLFVIFVITLSNFIFLCKIHGIFYLNYQWKKNITLCILKTLNYLIFNHFDMNTYVNLINGISSHA